MFQLLKRMKNKILYTIVFCILLSSLFSSSTIRSLTFPGWGEMHEFNILTKKNNSENIQYIKDRSKAIMLTEGVIWISLIISKELSSSYENDFKLLGQNNADIDWSSINNDEVLKYAANVGNFDSFESYNHERRVNHLSTYDEGEGYEWDWQNDNIKRLKYDQIRNKSEKYDKIKTYMLASLLINRFVSTFDVLSIKKNHGRLVSFDVDNNLKLNFNYTF